MAVIAGKDPYTFSLQQAQQEMTMTGGAAAFFFFFFSQVILKHYLKLYDSPYRTETTCPHVRKL